MLMLDFAIAVILAFVLPTFLIGEYLFIFLAALALIHAIRQDRRHVFVWFASFLAGSSNDIFFMYLPLVDNFWQAQATIMLTPRLPLYICCVYCTFMYFATVSAWRLGLPTLAEACLSGLMGIMIYMPYDIIGIKFLWWTWHDTDPPISYRMLAFRTLWVITFTGTFSFLIRTVYLNWRRSEAVAMVAVCLLSTPLMMVQMALLQLISWDRQGVPTLSSLMVGVGLYLVAIARQSPRRSLLKHPCGPFIRAAPDFSINLALCCYYAALFCIMFFGRPEDHVSDGIHQTYGPCRVEQKDFSGQVRHRYVCERDMDEDWDFSCPAAKGELPADYSDWYVVCGRAIATGPCGLPRWLSTLCSARSPIRAFYASARGGRIQLVLLAVGCTGRCCIDVCNNTRRLMKAGVLVAGALVLVPWLCWRPWSGAPGAGAPGGGWRPGAGAPGAGAGAPGAGAPGAGALVLAPLVLAPLVLAPWCWRPCAGAPGAGAPGAGALVLVLAPLVLAPLVLAPLVLAPLVLARPWCWRPGAGALVLAPLVLAPWCWAPGAGAPGAGAPGAGAPGAGAPVLAPLVVLARPGAGAPGAGAPGAGALVLAPLCGAPGAGAPGAGAPGAGALVLAPWCWRPLVLAPLVLAPLCWRPGWLVLAPLVLAPLAGAPGAGAPGAGGPWCWRPVLAPLAWCWRPGAGAPGGWRPWCWRPWCPGAGAPGAGAPGVAPLVLAPLVRRPCAGAPVLATLVLAPLVLKPWLKPWWLKPLVLKPGAKALVLKP
uniref:Integral membrane protein n=1 Tax=Macrostomum lignano TaxID=282301 RepID=A0A1I8FS69_9PLAT